VISDGGVPLCVFHRKIASEAVKAATSTIPGSFRLQTSTLQGNAGKTERDRVLTDEKTNRNSLVRSGSATRAYRLALGVDSCKLANVDL